MQELDEIMAGAELHGTLTKGRSLSDLSWLKVGGPAQWLFQPADAADLARFMRALPEAVPVMPIGLCSNLIIRDGGIQGVVIRLGGRGFGQLELLDAQADGAHGRLHIGAALPDAMAAKRAAQLGLDLSFLRTIPGSVGGAIAMNAGCYGRYMADVLEEVTGVTREGEVQTLPASALRLSYRESHLPAGFVITSAVLAAPRAAPEAIEARMEAALEARAKTQPVNALSCGSTFRNPAGYSSTGHASDTHDLKAWAVIDRAGLRGHRIGGAQMSPMHPNFMINTGGATAADLETLGEFVRKRVYETQQIDLQWEIKRVGAHLAQQKSPES